MHGVIHGHDRRILLFPCHIASQSVYTYTKLFVFEVFFVPDIRSKFQLLFYDQKIVAFRYHA